MEITLKTLLGLVTLICLLGGTNLLLKGAHAFLPAGTPPQCKLDNLMRFLSGIYFGLGFLMAWVVLHFDAVGDLTYFIGLVVIFSGLGRLYSRINTGPAGKYFDFVMVFEVALGLAIVLLEYFK